MNKKYDNDRDKFNLCRVHGFWQQLEYLPINICSSAKRLTIWKRLPIMFQITCITNKSKNLKLVCFIQEISGQLRPVVVILMKYALPEQYSLWVPLMVRKHTLLREDFVIESK